MVDIAALRKIQALHDLPEDQLQWLSAHGEEFHIQIGEIVIREGEPAAYMFIVFEGGFRIRRDQSETARVFDVEAGDISGILPYSRLKVFQGTARALSPTHYARFHKDIFPELHRCMPLFGERLVNLLMDRVRDVTRRDEQQEKLASLGKLSAGLAHELNNPAAAVRRAAKSLTTTREKLRAAYLQLDQRELTTAQRKSIAAFENTALASAREPVSNSTSLDRADREEELIEWMDDREVCESYNLAPSFVESGVTTAQLDELMGIVGPEALSDVLKRVDLVIRSGRLVVEIEIGANRISELVGSIKRYTYMDQAPEQEVDIHEGIEETLTMIGFSLRKKSITVQRNYDKSIPKICAAGAELNQVWTNLISNAIDAMNTGGELQLKTWEEAKDIYVEVRDNGSGIPKNVQSHIFEPFFTTKGVGEGTGLGLDTVQRIIRRHRGEVCVESEPGDTRFQVRLPKQT
jgi:signal transduction histidine kinase